MKNVFLAAVVVFVGFVSESFAQQTKKEWTLKECVDIALENNLRIKRSIYNVETFKANMLQAKGAFLPTLNANALVSNNYGRALNPTTNLFVDRNSTTTSPQINSSVTLFNGLRLQNTFKQNQRDVLAADYDLQKAKNDVILNVVTLYTNVIFNQELHENAKYQLNSSQQTLERIKKQVDAGALSLSNQLNQEAQVATNELNEINQGNALLLSILQLKQAMQIPGSEPMEIQIPDLELEDLVLDQNAESVYQVALNTMPEIKSAMLKVESAEMAMKANRGSYLPRLTLNGSISSNSSSLNVNSSIANWDGKTWIIPPDGVANGPSGINGTTGEYVYRAVPAGTIVTENYSHASQLSDFIFKSVSLQLTIPILNGFATRAAVQRSMINREVADVTVKETQNTLRQSIETAYNDAAAASRSYTSSLKQVKAQEEAYRMNKQRFDVGALNIIEYQISENDVYRAKSDLTRAKYNFIFKKKVLDFYQGKQIEY
jgi:outer membrane protein